jgi:hypothetical protein
MASRIEQEVACLPRSDKISVYDNLFNTLFIVISITVAPFISYLFQSPFWAYKYWAAFSFAFPILLTIFIWATAVFSNSLSLRVVGWSALLFQIARAPFIILFEILALTSFVSAYFFLGGIVFIVPAIIESIIAIILGEMVVRRYCQLGRRSPRLVHWIPPFTVISMAAFSQIIASQIDAAIGPWTGYVTVTSANTTFTLPTPVGVPGFTPESLLLGLVVGFCMIAVLRYKAQKRKATGHNITSQNNPATK